MRVSLGIAAWGALAVLTGSLAPSLAIAQAPDSLVFSLGPVKRWVGHDVFTVGFAVRNLGAATLYLSQHPGAQAWIGCPTRTGGGMGGTAGTGSRDGDLAREYFLRLAPGEALMGEVTLAVPRECLEPVTVYGEYQATGDLKWGTSAPDLRLKAIPIEVRRTSGRGGG